MLRTPFLACSFLVLLGLPGRSAAPRGPTPLPPNGGCSGCQGVGGLLATATNQQGGTLSISVAFPEQGECKWVLPSIDALSPVCRSVKGCDPLVTREWEGLPPDTPLKFTIALEGHTLVLLNPAVANTGSGTGENEFDSAEMPCDDSKVRSFGVECVPCGMEVSTQVICTSCSSY